MPRCPFLLIDIMIDMRKTLNLDKSNKLFIDDSVLTNLDKLISLYGMRFNIEYDGKVVPIVVKRRIDADSQVYRISIAYPTTQSMEYPTLSMSIGTNEDDEVADINYVHRNGDYGLSGTYIVQLAVIFLKTIGVRKMALTDAASIYDKNTKCTLQLSPYMLLKKSTTFYGKFGFRPYNPNPFYTAYDNDEQAQNVLCQRVKEVQKLRVSSIITFLQRMEKLLKKAGNSDALQMLVIDKDYVKGIDREYKYEDFYGKGANHVLHMVGKMINSLEKYKTLTIFQMMQQCTCKEFKSLQKYFMYLPSVINYKTTTLKHKSQSMFDEMMNIVFNSSYILDLTQPVRAFTC